jgi:hypothetical protein
VPSQMEQLCAQVIGISIGIYSSAFSTCTKLQY